MKNVAGTTSWGLFFGSFFFVSLKFGVRPSIVCYVGAVIEQTNNMASPNSKAIYKTCSCSCI